MADFPVHSRRRGLRFGLRNLLFAMLVIGGALGWLASKMQQNRHEEAIASQLRRQGASVQFERSVNHTTPSRWRKIWRELFKPRVIGVRMHNASNLDLRIVGELTKLISLDLASCQVSDLTPLAKLKSLKILKLNGTQVRDLTPCAGLKELEQLLLAETNVNDLTPLASLDHLHQMDVSATLVSDLTPLASHVNMETLDLKGTPVSNVTPLARMKRLAWLDLGGTEVRDLSPLASLHGLKSLYLHRLPVSDEHIQNVRQLLPNCEIVGWPPNR